MTLSWRDETVHSWGMVTSGPSQVLRPTSAAEVVAALAEIRAAGGVLGLRGAGCSYGDASMNTGGKLLDMSAMNRILEFDEAAGTADVEPGVTIRQLWRQSIEKRFWPAVVPGTMAVTCGGAAAMNIHGKNNFAVGTFGDNILEFTMVTGAGRDPELQP